MTNSCGVSNSWHQKQYDIVCSTAEIRYPMNMALEKLSHSMWAWLNPNGATPLSSEKLSLFFLSIQNQAHNTFAEVSQLPTVVKGVVRKYFCNFNFYKKHKLR